MFVKRFSYLGIILDEELLLEPLYKNVCRQIEQKLFMLRKVCRYITTYAAISLYKQMILPLLDYSGFLLLSCNLGQKRELQRIQNKCIRTCLLYNRVDHITIEQMQNEMKIVSLEQRRQIQTLTLMYRLIKNPKYIKHTDVNTRGNVKKKFSLKTKCMHKYLNSPLYRGASLWDELDKNVQDLPTLKHYTKEIMKKTTCICQFNRLKFDDD